MNFGMDLNENSNRGSTLLFLACKKGHHDTVNFLLDLNGDILNSRVDTTLKLVNGWSVLHIACFNGHIKVANLLISVGIDFNDTTNKGSTPLHQACHKGHYNTVKVLLHLKGGTLNSHVDTTIKNADGQLAFHAAYSNGHSKIVKLLTDVCISETIHTSNYCCVIG